MTHKSGYASLRLSAVTEAATFLSGVYPTLKYDLADEVIKEFTNTTGLVSVITTYISLS